MSVGAGSPRQIRLWVAIAAIVTVALGAILLLRSCGASSTRQPAGPAHAPARRTPHPPALVSSSEPDPAGGLRLAGRVIGPDGPVAGADITIDSNPRRTTTSAADGAFAFDQLITRSYVVRAISGELVGGPHVVRLDEHTGPLTIRLSEGAHVVVSVVDGVNAPVADAEVRLVGVDTVAVTDDDGQARLTTHPGTIEVEATAAGFAPRRVTTGVGSPGATARLTIVLHEGFPVRGRVVDESGKAIAKVRIYAHQLSAFAGPSDSDRAAALTADDGTFTIPAAVGMHSLIAIDDEHAPATTPTFDVDRAISGLEIVMKRGGVYAGVVVDTAGKPVPHARVYGTSLSWLGRRRRVVTADERGAFELRGLPSAMLVAYAESDAGVSEQATIDLSKQPEQRGHELVVTAGDAKTVIAGVVVDDRGTPVPDITVNAALNAPGDFMTSEVSEARLATSASTDASGRFAITGLPRGEYALWAGALAARPPPPEAARFALSHGAPWQLAIASTGDRNVRIVMTRFGGINGNVVFADTGAPVPSFRVDIHPSYTFGWGTPYEAGAFEVRDLVPMVVTVRVSGPGFTDTRKADVRIEPGKTTDVGTIAVSRGRTVRGTVVDSAGRPVAGARVLVGFSGVYGGTGTFDPPLLDEPSAISDANGRFAIAGIETMGQFLAAAHVAGADHPLHGRAVPVPIPNGPSDPPPITLALQPCGSIAGKVMQSGAPMRDAIIGAGWPEIGAGTTTDDGAFVISRLPAGPIELRVMPADVLRSSYRTTVNVEPGQQTSVTIDVPVGTIELAVAVEPKAGHEVPGAMLFLFVGTQAFETFAQLSARAFADGQGSASWERDANRPGVFGKLVPGDYTVCTMPLAWTPKERSQMRRVYDDRDAVKVYCTPVRVAPAPAKQTLTVEVPAMAPLPNPP